jgi:hypothetical protein
MFPEHEPAREKRVQDLVDRLLKSQRDAVPEPVRASISGRGAVRSYRVGQLMCEELVSLLREEYFAQQQRFESASRPGAAGAVGERRMSATLTNPATAVVDRDVEMCAVVPVVVPCGCTDMGECA